MVKNLNLLCPINNLSYGLVSSNFAFEIWKSKEYNISLFPLNEQTVEAEPYFHPFLKETIGNRQYFDVNADCIKIWHQWDFATSIGRGRRIGFPIFELDSLTKLEVHNLNSLDLVLVCSEWAKQVCISSGVISRIEVVPLGFNPDIFRPHPVITQVPILKEKTIFLNIGKWEIRKGHDELVNYFNKAFTKSDNVELWMCCDNVHLSPEENKEWRDYYLNSSLGEKIKIIPRQESQHQIAYLINNCLAGIYPTRAEGYNLDAIETIACSKPCIIGNYGGHTEYVNDKTCVLVEPDTLEPAVDSKWFLNNGITNTGNWMSLTLKVEEQFIEGMRFVHNNPDKVKNMSQQCIKHAENFTWNRVTQQLIKVLKDVV